ncbi:response regulator [bacterium]|nr:response regulator [bacterium]
MICDDSQVQRVIVKKTILTYFQKYNINILEASNGQEAFNILKNPEINVNLLFLDLEMPVLNGWQLLEMIENKDVYDLKLELSQIIIFSANPALRQQAQSMILNVFKKPFLPVKLAEKLKPVIDSYSEASIIQTKKMLLIEDLVDNVFLSFSKVSAANLTQPELVNKIVKDLNTSKDFDKLLTKARLLKNENI